ncbi:MAG: type IV pilus secretin PilQ [Gammaproteobacteria bacterium]|jgi:type IV pilus assembly protein PilQ|nr:type IV pilus secretin PilQ [Gammaproteobacteria bacterium]
MSDRLQTSKVTLFKSFRQNGRRACHNLFAAACLLLGSTVAAQAADTASGNTLQSVDVAGLPGNKAQITLTLSNPAPAPLSFTIDNPARIALDFPNTSNGLAQRSQEIGIGMAESLTAVEAQGRTRVVVNLVDMVPYEAHAEGNKIILTVQNAGSQMSEAAVAAARASGDGDESINNIDFRRGEDGQGRVIVSLSDPSVPVDMQQQGGKVLVDFYRTQLPEELERRLDVLDFATPVKTIDTYTRGDNVHMVITPMGEYEYIAYQTDNQFTIEVRELTREEVEEAKKDEFGFSGERLSLNFQDIEVRSVLQLIADFTGLNVVVSDTVRGSLTLRLKNVPWDQALDIILKTKGLGMRQTGNVMLVAPSEEIAAREKLELESKKQIEELEPLYSEYIQVNYAKASDLATLLKSSDTTLMSDRGMVTTDKRTNTLLVQDTAAKLVEVRQLVARLDIPVRQVLIESRIVIANNDFSKELGVKFGLNKQTEFNGGNNIVSVGGTRPGDPRTGGGGVIDPDFTNPESSADNLLVDLGVVGASSSIGMAIGKIGSYMLNLELSAMEAEGQGEIISSPRVLTSNQKAAFIESGTEIPYQEATSSGATSTEFQKAVLSLSVTPQITPDDRLIMDLQISKDSVGEFSVDGIPSIDTNEVSTQVLVDDGETLVLGGIYEQIKRNEVDRTPFFGELPLVDWMFKKTLSQDDRAELLIFVTPKIVKEELNI